MRSLHRIFAFLPVYYGCILKKYSLILHYFSIISVLGVLHVAGWELSIAGIVPMPSAKTEPCLCSIDASAMEIREILLNLALTLT